MEQLNKAFSKLVHWQYFPLLVLMAVIVGLHLATITRPNTPLFDEQHYVTDARSIDNGQGTLRTEHPPLAKLIIAWGIKLFGDNPWGWRMPAVILSTIALIAFYDICRKLGTSHRTAFVATLLLGTENLMFIHSGMAMLDIYVVVFTIFAFWFYLRGSRWWWASAVMVALAGLSKFSGILSVIPIGLHWFIIGYKPNMGNPVPEAPAAIAGGFPPALPVETARQPEPASAPAEMTPVPAQTEPVRKTFWQSYSRPLIFILSMLVAPLAFFLLFGVFDMIIWQKFIPLFVWGHWDQGVVGDIKIALEKTDSIKFAYGGAFPARPWEWILSPTGSLYFFGWLAHPENYKDIFLPYWYTPSYSGILSPSLWLSGLCVIPIAIWNAFKKNNAFIFIACWLIGTYVAWIPLFLATNRITYMFYYLPTIGAIAMGTALLLTGFLDKARAQVEGFRKHFLKLAAASFLLLHLLAFCILSPLQLWISAPVCALALFFSLGYLGFGWRFIIEFYDSAAIAGAITRFVFYRPLVHWLAGRYTLNGLGTSWLIWAIAALLGLALTWILFTVIHLAVNGINKTGARPQVPTT